MDNIEIENKVKDYFLQACEPLNRIRYAQESAYVDAFIARLEGEIDFGQDYGLIKFTPTIVADRGYGSAESKYGADFAIVFKSKGIDIPIDKAIISQAKNGTVDKLSNSESLRLKGQCEKMARITENYIVLETPNLAGAMPTVRIGVPKAKLWGAVSIPFDEYFLNQVLSCQHGDKRKDFITGVASSKLSGIKVDVDGIKYTPFVKPRKKPRLKW